MTLTNELAGKTFGKWYVRERDFERKNKKDSAAYWWCDCTCGRTTASIKGSALLKGRSRQCVSCARESKLTGETFGRLTVVRMSGKKASNGNNLWECNCSCGTKGILVRGASLSSGNTKSCGCYARERRIEGKKPDFEKYERIAEYYLTHSSQDTKKEFLVSYNTINRAFSHIYGTTKQAYLTSRKHKSVTLTNC